MEFEWDEDKVTNNSTRQRVLFLTAAEIFANEILEWIGDREEPAMCCICN